KEVKEEKRKSRSEKNDLLRKRTKKKQSPREALPALRPPPPDPRGVGSRGPRLGVRTRPKNVLFCIYRGLSGRIRVNGGGWCPPSEATYGRRGARKAREKR